jgi:hypothetical protein
MFTLTRSISSTGKKSQPEASPAIERRANEQRDRNPGRHEAAPDRESEIFAVWRDDALEQRWAGDGD